MYVYLGQKYVLPCSQVCAALGMDLTDLEARKELRKIDANKVGVARDMACSRLVLFFISRSMVFQAVDVYENVK